jgi:hypothetical protein
MASSQRHRRLVGHPAVLSPSRRVGLAQPRAAPNQRGRYLEISEANSAGNLARQAVSEYRVIRPEPVGE